MRARSSAALIAVAFAVLGFIGCIAAYLFRDAQLQFLPGSGSPVGFFLGAAVICFGLSIGVPSARAAERMDAAFAREESVHIVAGALASVAFKLALREALDQRPAYLPNRVSLIGSDLGIELWGRPGQSRFVVVPWPEISGFSATKISLGGRLINGLAIGLSRSTLTLEVPLVGRGVVGVSSLSEQEAIEVARKFSALQSDRRLHTSHD